MPRWRPGDCTTNRAWHPLLPVGAPVTPQVTRELFEACGLESPELEVGPYADSLGEVSESRVELDEQPACRCIALGVAIQRPRQRSLHRHQLRRLDAGTILTTILVLGLALRVFIAAVLLPLSGLANDIGAFNAWGQRLASVGPAGFYEPGYFAEGWSAKDTLAHLIWDTALRLRTSR